MPSDLECPVCGSHKLSVFFEIHEMPIHVGVQWFSRKEALNCPKGNINLAFCEDCSFITNIAYNLDLLGYTQAYDNSLHHSSLFQKYAYNTASRLIDRYNLRNKVVIEIGCGKGDFLKLLCELGNNQGVGFDPSYEPPHPDGDPASNLTFIKDFYSERYSDFKADLICCRQVLEHIHNPADLITMLRGLIADRYETVLYFEVPNVSYILNDFSIWDIIYEHCCYFSSISLTQLFNSCGFKAVNLNTTFENQFIEIESFPSKQGIPSKHNEQNNIKRIQDQVVAFSKNHLSRTKSWLNNFQQFKKTKQRSVVWGAGARGVSFLNLLKDNNYIDYIVDINPNKHGKYMPGTGQEIVSPKFLCEYHPDQIIIMNPIYKKEIKKSIEELNIKSEVIVA